MSKKKIILIIVAVIIVFSIIDELTKKKGKNPDESVIITTDYITNEYPIMNGTGDKQLGARLEILYQADNITDEEILKIYDKKIKDSAYNWVTIKLNNNYGITVSPGTPILNFGYLDKLGRNIDTKKTGIIKNNIIEYSLN